MPKMKSHKGAKSRFKVTPTGKIRRRRANMNHFLGKKSSSRKRRLNRTDAVVSEADTKRIRKMLGK
ncbi:MAG: large subunit ribosomal protein [Actinomycetota bacterium]|jgi:large subunit ribosomal protein L35|nr:large subunit ribosomal protein [Actinomycetota bacterium]